MKVGAQLTYTITVSNAGPDTANGVQVVDDLDSQVDFVSATASQGSCDQQGKKVTCELGVLALDETASVTIKVTPKKEGQVSNTATVTTIDTDSNSANDTATETTTVVPQSGGPSCGGKAATIVGTEGDDTIVGTDKRDVIAALGGTTSSGAYTARTSSVGARATTRSRARPTTTCLRAGRATM